MYSAGDCSVCASGGFAIFVKALGTGKIFFSCPDCGCAWSTVPEAFVVDTIDPPASFGGEGFCVATVEEIASAGLTDLVRSEVDQASSGSPRDDGLPRSLVRIEDAHAL
jgi:hypothetical protein